MSPPCGFRRLVSPPPYALGGNMDACCRLVFIVVCEARVLYFSPALFLLLGVLIFPRRSSLRVCPSQWGIPAIVTVMTRSHVVGQWLPHWRSSEGSPAHFGRFCLTPFLPVLIVPAPKGPPSSNPVPAFQRTGMFLLNSSSSPFLGVPAPMVQRSNDLHPGFAA